VVSQIQLTWMEEGEDVVKIPLLGGIWLQLRQHVDRERWNDAVEVPILCPSGEVRTLLCRLARSQSLFPLSQAD